MSVLDIYLDHNETVDHIDGNFNNNELSNLRVVPNDYNKGNSLSREKNELISNRSLIGEIQPVEGANSGKLLVGNPEQEI